MTSTLKDDFKKRSDWNNNRSSAIYPIDIRKNSDFAIVFINYWKLKNRIKSLACNLRLFDQEGNLIKVYKHNLKTHNEILFSKIFKIENFLGMLEVEFISLENLKFLFPGITGFYISPSNIISGVHSAGRIKNKNEINKKDSSSLETNFTLKFNKNNKITPFISLFNSNSQKKKNPIFLVLKDKFNKTVKKITIDNELKKPFSNKIFYLDNYFNNDHLSNSDYCIVKTNSVDVFPRMVCGNYHKNLHHYEVTHSFPLQKNNSDRIDNNVLKKREVDHMSFLPFVKSKKINLKLRVFPTNLKSNLNAILFLYNKKKSILEKKKNIIFNPGKKMFEYTLKNNEEFGCISLKQKNIPSRINTSYIYSNKNKLGLTTDTALGFKSIEYPVKQTHWGSFYSSSKIETEILIRRINHYKCNKKATGIITFYGYNFKKTIKLNLKPTDFKIINFSKILKKQNNISKSYSWIAKFKKGSGIEIFWNSYGKNFISGCHAF